MYRWKRSGRLYLGERGSEVSGSVCSMDTLPVERRVEWVLVDWTKEDRLWSIRMVRVLVLAWPGNGRLGRQIGLHVSTAEKKGECPFAYLLLCFLGQDNNLYTTLYNPLSTLFIAYTLPYSSPKPPSSRQYHTWTVSTNPVASPSQSSSKTLLLKSSLVRLNIVQRALLSLAALSMYATICPSPLLSTPRHALESTPHLRLRRNNPLTLHHNHPLTPQTMHCSQSGRSPRARAIPQ